MKKEKQKRDVRTLNGGSSGKRCESPNNAMDTESGYRKSTIFVFAATVFIVAALQILLPYSGVGKAIRNSLFIWGFLGLACINILLFVIPLCIGLGRLMKSDAKGDSQKQESQRDEKELKELLEGDSVVKREMPAWARIGVTICIGLIAGSILGYILDKIIM